MTQEYLAGRTGISPRTIQRIEAGETDMKLSQYHKILKALDITHMDVSIAMLDHQFVTEREVAALVRLYPFQAKKVILRFLNEMLKVISPDKKGP